MRSELRSVRSFAMRLSSAMPMNVAWSARWRLFGALRIILYVAMRKNPEPPKRLVKRPVGRPCGVAGPGVASLGPAREKILAKRTNTNPIHRARPAGRPVGSACGVLSPSDAGQVRLESAVRGDSKQPSSRLRSCIRMSLRTLWQRVGPGGGGHVPLSKSSSRWLELIVIT